MLHQSIRVAEGNLAVGRKRLKISEALATTDDADDARRSAALLGRWFARQREPFLIMQALGVTP
jgi:hypothetical protein